MHEFNNLKTICDNQICTLTKEQPDQVRDFLENLKRQEAKIIYRGINKMCATQRIVICDSSSVPFGTTMHYLFKIGEKAKILLGTTGEYLSDEDSVLDNCLRPLIQMTKKTLQSSSNYGLDGFKSDNKKFTKFFEFVDESHLIAMLCNHQRILLRNLLLSYIHRIEKGPLCDKSPLVSASTDYEFASNVPEGDSIVIISWIPKPEFKYAITSDFSAPEYKALWEIGIPKIDEPILKHEREISLIGAIFPHFIWGVHDVESNETIINPNIFLTDSRRDVLKNGLQVDQSDFHDLIKNTKYRNYVTMNDSQLSPVSCRQ